MRLGPWLSAGESWVPGQLWAQGVLKELACQWAGLGPGANNLERAPRVSSRYILPL